MVCKRLLEEMIFDTMSHTMINQSTRITLNNKINNISDIKVLVWTNTCIELLLIIYLILNNYGINMLISVLP